MAFPRERVEMASGRRKIVKATVLKKLFRKSNKCLKPAVVGIEKKKWMVFPQGESLDGVWSWENRNCDRFEKLLGNQRVTFEQKVLNNLKKLSPVLQKETCHSGVLLL
ncbi:hypothetical protein CEXT_514761 [Caerostris extrusa]|uniref:Uncharacterized protein n=1 Tax=Caerostris extrusa TaxID=172846 RepID=A0AAV4NIM2_CAEEX|nr:hypothetical protein CEXT_514761 [Caerostris extrusa]